MTDVLINTLYDMKIGITQMPIFKAGNAYMTLDLTEDDMVGLEPGELPVPTSLSLIVTAEHVATISALMGTPLSLSTYTDSPLVLISLEDLFNIETPSGMLYTQLSGVINYLIADFFGSNYVSMYYNGPCLGAMFEMVHYNA